MGYYVSTREVDVTVPADKVDAAFEAVKELNKHDNMKRGGSWGATGRSQAWFSWMDPDYDKTAAGLADVFTMLGFEDSEYREDDTFVLGAYDSKTGQEDLFLETIAPFVADGSHIMWEGEDGELWVNVFDQGAMETKNVKIVW